MHVYHRWRRCEVQRDGTDGDAALINSRHLRKEFTAGIHLYLTVTLKGEQQGLLKESTAGILM